MKDKPDISLILPAYNERRGIGRTIAEARDYFAAQGLTHEIIVAADGDDGTREHVAELAQSWPNLKVLGSVERRGKGHGIRQAVQLARGRVIGFSDADNFRRAFERCFGIAPSAYRGRFSAKSRRA